MLKTQSATLSVGREGGRIVSLKSGNLELLTQKREHENYGSTLWTGPQSEWGWPPYQVLDENRYDAIFSSDSLFLISKKDSLSGFQISKSIRADKKKDCFVITYAIRNISTTTKKVDAWEVTRVPVGGTAFFPEGENADLPASNLEGISKENGFVWFSCDMKPMRKGQKLFATGKNGWLAYYYKDVLFIKRFPDVLPEQLSPQQGEVEIYANEERVYFELENHGPYTSLFPGQLLQYQVIWHIKKLSSKTSFNREQLISKVQSILNQSSK
jgi:hypothetical protein